MWYVINWYNFRRLTLLSMYLWMCWIGQWFCLMPIQLWILSFMPTISKNFALLWKTLWEPHSAVVRNGLNQGVNRNTVLHGQEQTQRRRKRVVLVLASPVFQESWRKSSCKRLHIMILWEKLKSFSSSRKRSMPISYFLKLHKFQKFILITIT